MSGKIGIIDYGMGNLHSVRNALTRLGADSFISGDAVELAAADRLILPGVGAFPDAMDALNSSGLVDFIRGAVKEKPLLGICLGMQLLLGEGHEFRECKGLGLIGGEAVRLTAADNCTDGSYKIPHMGWNSLAANNAAPECLLLDGIADGAYFYFVHSFKAVTADASDTAAYAEYGEPIAAVIHRGNVYGTQFHPEKSESVGLKLLQNFIDLC